MVSPERLQSMQANWVALLARFSVAPADAYPAFDQLAAAYSEPDRHYHNLEHLAEMFRVAGRLTSSIRDPAAVQLAIWFHDAVYDTRMKDNESRSAEFARELLVPLGVPTKTIASVMELIGATAHLTARESPSDGDAAVLLDADLAILGASWERYRRYAQDIRKEYDWVPDDRYREGRTTVLRAFLDRPRIYRHPVMIQEGETRARENMTAELATLADQSGSGKPVLESLEPHSLSKGEGEGG